MLGSDKNLGGFTMKITIPKLIILAALVVLGFFGYKYYAQTYASQKPMQLFQMKYQPKNQHVILVVKSNQGYTHITIL